MIAQVDIAKLAVTLRKEYAMLLHSVRPVQNARDCYGRLCDAVASTLDAEARIELRELLK